VCIFIINTPSSIIPQGVEVPVQEQDIGKVENNNRVNINIFRLSKSNKTFPAMMSTKKFPTTIDLLQIKRGANPHFCLIKDLAAFIDTHKHRRRRFICKRCLYLTTNGDKYRLHQQLCQVHKVQRTYVPPKNAADGSDIFSYLPPNSNQQVTNFESDLPFIVVADLESLLIPATPEEALRGIVNTHKPISACYKLISTDTSFYESPKIFYGTNVIAKFLDSLLEDAFKLREILNNHAPLSLTPEQRDDIDSQTECHLCKGAMSESEEYVVDHDHLTGCIRGNPPSPFNTMLN